MRNSPARISFTLLVLGLLTPLKMIATMASRSGSSAFQCFTTSSPTDDNTYQSRYDVSASDERALLPLSIVAAPILRSIQVDEAGQFRNRETAPSLFVRDCSCEFDWVDAFCLRAEHYRRIDPIDAPTICICRQLGDVGNCRQFITRCFLDSALLRPGRKRPPSSTLRRLSGGSRRREKDSCSCCLNQPDEYCGQLDCIKMHPDFGRETSNSTSCVCYDQSSYPHQLCSASSSFFKHSPSGSRSDGRSALGDVFERWSAAVTPIEQVVAVTFRPSSMGNTSQSNVPSSYSTHGLTVLRSLPAAGLRWLLLVAIIVLTIAVLCLGLLLIQRRRRSARSKAALARDGNVLAADEVAELRPLTSNATAAGNGQGADGTVPVMSNSLHVLPNTPMEQQLFV